MFNKMPHLEDQYLASLTSKEKLVYELAKKCLGSSFDLQKSIGFLRWIKNNNF
jgi:hypothetical protein